MSASSRKVDFVPGAIGRKNSALVTSGGGHDDVKIERRTLYWVVAEISQIRVERGCVLVKLRNVDNLTSTPPYLTRHNYLYSTISGCLRLSVSPLGVV